MEHTSIGTQKLRRVGNSLVITIPKQAAEQLGLSDGDLVDIQLAPMELRPRMRPEVRASFEAVLPTIQPGLDYLKDRQVAVYLTLQDVLDLHLATMEATGSEPQPVRSLPGIESALMRGQTAGYYDGHDVIGQAARIATGISRAQGFLDGNKRTALAVTAVLLNLNGLRLTGDMLAGAKLLDALADPSVSDDEADHGFGAWLREHTAT